MPRTLATLPRQYRESWSASIDDRVVCPSVRWPLVAAAKALLMPRTPRSP